MQGFSLPLVAVTVITLAAPAVAQRTAACNDQWPQWSPGGRSIVFSSDRTGDPEVFVQDLPAGAAQQLTRTPGLTLKPAGASSLLALQFTDRRVFYYGTLVLWAIGLWVWWRLDRSMARDAMEAIGEDETAAASVGIHVTRFKLGITVLSAALTALGGVAYAQYIAYVNPETLSGIGVSLRIVFAVFEAV